MTPYFFLACFFLGLILTVVRHPVYGLYTYLFTFYMAPGYGWWRHDIPDVRYMFLVGIVTILATLRMPVDPDRAKWYQTGAGKLLLLFVLYNWLQILWAVNRDMQLDGAILYTKHLVIFYLMYYFASSLERIKDISIAHVIGCGWFGYQALGAGGGRLEEIGGAVAGSNQLAQHVATGLLFGGILFIFLKGLRRWLVFGAMPLVANTLVLTISRGGFLGFVGGGLAGYLAIPKAFKARYRLIAMLGVVLIGMLAHDQFIDRFVETYKAFTSEDKQLDTSATSRTEIAKAGFAIALDHPLGAGHKATALLSYRYLDERFHSRDGGRSAHNTFAAVVAEHGFPGLLIYVLTILWVVRAMLHMRRIGTYSPSSEITELQLCAAFLFSALMALYGAGNFSNSITVETQYWCLALLASVYELRKKELVDISEATTPERARRGSQSPSPVAARRREEAG